MDEESRSTGERKLYAKPAVRRVQLDSLEATLGTGCWQPGVSILVQDNCGSGPLTSCLKT
jgi:hypothetical protein